MTLIHILFSQQYNLDITDMNQALLVTHPKRISAAGAAPPGPAMLIPELCYLTGDFPVTCLPLSIWMG